MGTPAEVVDAVYAALFAGDAERALGLCAPGGQWHTLTPFHEWHGSYPLETYAREVAPRALTTLPGYRVDSMERDEIDTLLVARIRSSWNDGAERARGSGVTVYRVADGNLTDIWSMSSDPSRPY